MIRLVVEMLLTQIGVVLGGIGAFLAFISILAQFEIIRFRKPKIETSEITAHDPQAGIRGGTILIRRSSWDQKPIIPAIYGSINISNKNRFFSETLKSCKCRITLKKDGDKILEALAPWAPVGQRSLEQYIDLKKGEAEKLHIFRAIIEPNDKDNYNSYEERAASSFNILNIDDEEKPLYESKEGKVWIEMPKMIEAKAGGWHAQKKKPDKSGEYEIDIDLSADNLKRSIKKKINFKDWLEQNSNYWQESWIEECKKTIEKAKSTIDSIYFR